MDNPYALAQWSAALLTATTTSDDATRTRAQRRVSQWQSVIRGLRSGSLRLGSRTPVRGLPAWVTPEVMRGGFATGRAAASGPLSEFERQVARNAGVPEDRGAIFEYLLTEPGMRGLWTTLDGGGFEIDLPESAALLVVAWLVREGDADTALALVGALRPLAHDVRLLPASATGLVRDPAILWRESAGTVATALRRKTPPAQLLRMNGVLDVWNPFADRLLEQWLATMTDGRIDEPFSGAWLHGARNLLSEFDRLSVEHVPPTRHTNPKQNAATLRLALAAVADGRALTPRERGRIGNAVDAMVSRRGAPGTARLQSLRELQRAQAALPTTAALARLAADRLASASPDAGIGDILPFTAPVTAKEAASIGLPAATLMPPAVSRVLLRAKAGTLQELVDGGVITSAELLATFVPQLTAQVVAEQYEDPTLRILMARSYEAFRRRRSVLLLDLQHQVRPEELPWIAATSTKRRATSATRDVARETFLRLADEVIRHWPGSILPNPLVAELQTLAAAADTTVPLVQEIAADIFMGRFSTKYAAAFDLAAGHLAGTLYARYYRIGGAALETARRAANPAEAFSELCLARAQTPGHRWCVVCNGMVVEQAQILTTHNLASLVAAGFAPRDGWRTAAEGAFTHVAGHAARLQGNRRPQRKLKDLSYAWRQMVFYVAQLDDDRQVEFLDWARQDAVARPEFARERLLSLLDDLARPGVRPPLLGWGHGRHWLIGGTPTTA